MKKVAESAQTDELSEFFPLTTTRAETALSRFPIHNLTKAEKIDIRISQKDADGESDVYWSVSPSRDFGEPRQLAYKLDTLLINRRIDEAGRPIPRIIRLGSLREICRELGLTGGKSTGDVKAALQQNASAFITAKVSYRGTDGGESRFEASFSRYSLRFLGQTLPDGRRADAVYIILNDEYLALLNKVQFRPLNYDYLKQLTPSAQRFYEILSYRVFAAFSQSRPQARLRYSEYCTRAPQQRYTDGDRMRKQMYKIHLPHLRSCYIEDVEYRNCRDAKGDPDWELLYKPGKKAKAEFMAFTNRKLELVVQESEPVPSVEADSPELLAELTNRGISEKRSRELLKTLPKDQPVLTQLQFADSLIKSGQAGAIRNPPGFYIHFLQSNISPPQQVAAPAERRKPTARIIQEDEAIRKAHEAYQQEKVSQHIAERVGEGAFRSRVQKKLGELKRLFPNLIPEILRQSAEQAIRSEVLRELSLESLSDFAAKRRAA